MNDNKVSEKAVWDNYIPSDNENFTQTIYDLVAAGSRPQNAESKTLRHIIESYDKIDDLDSYLWGGCVGIGGILSLVFGIWSFITEGIGTGEVVLLVTLLSSTNGILNLRKKIKKAKEEYFNKKIKKEMEPEKAFLLDENSEVEDYEDEDDNEDEDNGNELSLDEDDDDGEELSLNEDDDAGEELNRDNEPCKKASPKRPASSAAVAVPAKPVAAVPAKPVAAAVPAEPVAAAVPAEPVAVAVPAESPTIKFYCIHCGKKIEAEVEWSGMEGECPHCGTALIIPEISKN